EPVGHARVAQAVGVEPGLLAQLARGGLGRRLAPFEAAGHRLPEPGRAHALEQQAFERARVYDDENGLRTLERPLPASLLARRAARVLPVTGPARSREAPVGLPPRRHGPGSALRGGRSQPDPDVLQLGRI